MHCKRNFHSPKPSSKNIKLIMAEIIEEKIIPELQSTELKKARFESTGKPFSEEQMIEIKSQIPLDFKNLTPT